MKTIFSLLCLSLTFQALASQKDIDVIYGEDNRMDVIESNDTMLKELSRSTAAMISPDFMRKTSGGYEIFGKTLKDKGACQKERFSQQLSVANCSGFLVSDNVLVTAGHCVKSFANCNALKWVFDYRVSANKSTITVPESSVYECKRVVARELSTVTKMDYAIIELNRRVSDRRPLTFRKTGSVSVGDSIAVIGHPSGLPTKITDGGKVRSLQTGYFVTNLDTYHGNSGSPVINTRSGEVEGILVRGDTDFVRSSGGCQVSKVCSADGCRGEDVTNIMSVEELQR